MPSRSVRLPRLSIRLSQNFLRDPLLIDLLVSRSDLTANDTVYEIGPGQGIITRSLAKVCHRVVTIEMDPSLAAPLRDQFRESGNIEVINADVLRFEFPDTPFKVFANIPFNITADILRKLLYASNPPSSAYLILQREAAEKYSGAQRESQASVLLKPWYDFVIAHRFDRSDFDPVPSIEVVLLDIKKRQTPLIQAADAELYRQFVIYGFGRQKASLGKSYKKVFSYWQWKRLAHDNGFDVHARPTDLNFDQWCSISRFFIEGTKRGWVKKPPEMSTMTTSAMSPPNIARSQNGSADFRWKNRKAKRAR